VIFDKFLRKNGDFKKHNIGPHLMKIETLTFVSTAKCLPANWLRFCLLGKCLLWAVFLYRGSPNFGDTFFLG
jgi:hypothetical protein